MLSKLLPLTLAAAFALAATPSALADGDEIRGYTASLGASAFGVGAASNNGVFGPGSFTSTHNHNRVTVVIEDDLGLNPYTTVCVDVNANGLCSTTDGDIQVNGFGTIVVNAGGAGFRSINVFVYALHVDATGPHVGSQGTVTVTWG